MSYFKKLVRRIPILAAGGLAALLLTASISGQAAPTANNLAENPGTESSEVKSETQDHKAALKPRSASHKVAVIIDDLGNGMAGTEEILNLPIKLTVAVMPFLETTQEDARRAHEYGHDVIIHMPMEPKQGKAEWLGPGAILSSMTDEEIRQRVEAAIDQVPYAIGMNNHMGSKVTEDERVMSVILEVCRERGLFFIDSKTNSRSVVPRLSEKMGLPRLENDIFLDDVGSEAHVTKQLRQVLNILNKGKRNSCVTIGHVGVQGKKTAAALKKNIPILQAEGVQFIGTSELVWEQISPSLQLGPGFTLP
ncbi:divergent polysaccharide deacetylase family protein [Paenibacillus phoenicis]|uniref:Divergent polysaccharide deacetylase family protein n=1 Tax=Paenibacillus phoenicis TaxID=554117 RepID=A0ABU5PGI8_9BACL|nr:divergent polysaccharide deacetylase family protein [Paenibacillus phoenicis]MEA3569058.1 divergent polysaccharide deacetylase family protein [Paenibacillus phoenicis]